MDGCRTEQGSSLRRGIVEVGRALLDLLVPCRCGGCGAVLLPAADPSFLCAACAPSLVEVEAPCPTCGLPGRRSGCLICRVRPLPFYSARSSFIYGGQLAVAIQSLKYRGATHLARPLGYCLAHLAAEGPPGDVVVPVPLHRRRLARRGYNQAALLAATAARAAGLPCLPLALQRTRDTATQAALGPRERRENVAGAFAATNRSKLAGRRVLLVDDVMTTGATAAAATEALLEAGARAVHVLTLARAMP